MIVLAVDVEKKLGTFKLAVRFEAAGGATPYSGRRAPARPLS